MTDTEELQKLRLEKLASIKHLNRLATWAQQDPTGPWEKLEIQNWVLNEIKGALGQPVEATKWQPAAPVGNAIIDAVDKATRDEAIARLRAIAAIATLHQIVEVDEVDLRYALNPPATAPVGDGALVEKLRLQLRDAAFACGDSHDVGVHDNDEVVLLSTAISYFDLATAALTVPTGSVKEGTNRE